MNSSHVIGPACSELAILVPRTSFGLFFRLGLWDGCVGAAADCIDAGCKWRPDSFVRSFPRYVYAYGPHRPT